MPFGPNSLAMLWATARIACFPAANAAKLALALMLARQHDEAGHVIAPLDDLDPEVGDLGDGLIDLAGVVAAIGPDQFEPWEARADLVEDEGGAVAIPRS